MVFSLLRTSIVIIMIFLAVGYLCAETVGYSELLCCLSVPPCTVSFPEKLHMHEAL